MSRMTLADARDRFSQVAAALAAAPDARGIRTGFAERLHHHESANQLIERADGELVAARGQAPGRSAGVAIPRSHLQQRRADDDRARASS